jgi:hypothetical protein
MKRGAAHTRLYWFLLLAAINSCVHSAPEAGDNTSGEIVYAKLVVYGEILRNHLAPDWRDHYSAIFLDGTPSEQRIFLREFRSHSYPVEDIAQRVPPYYYKNSNAVSGGAALYFKAQLVESHYGFMVFDIIGSDIEGINQAVVIRDHGEWILKEWSHRDTGVFP